MKAYSVAINSSIQDILRLHLVRADGQEDLCFATYVPSTGKNRFSGLLTSVILPEAGERQVHGNASFGAHYFQRALRIATERNEGLAFLHSHPVPGWQGMSPDDVRAETTMAPATRSATGLPLLGLTMGTDGSWSGRFWEKHPTQRRHYVRMWCENARVVGQQLNVTSHPSLLPAAIHQRRQRRTISAWGQQKQSVLSCLKVGIVGVGSVGSAVAEILARTGITRFVLIDFDLVEEKNLDRLTGVYRADVGKLKVDAVGRNIRRSASGSRVSVEKIVGNVCEEAGFRAALDCDVLFCCVDRHWPRQVLNFLAYTHLIPVIDGGILVRTNRSNTALKGADWKAQTVGFSRRCLECWGQYDPATAQLERNGMLDDPAYIQGLPVEAVQDNAQNVSAFGVHLASMEVLQLLSMVLAPSGSADVGQQTYHFVLGKLDCQKLQGCEGTCLFPALASQGDRCAVKVHT